MKFAWPESHKREFVKWGSMAWVDSSGGGSVLLDGLGCDAVSGFAVEAVSEFWADIGITEDAIIRSRAKRAQKARRCTVDAGFAPVPRPEWREDKVQNILKMNFTFIITS